MKEKHIQKILKRKKQGVDCSEEESAELKGYIKQYPKGVHSKQIEKLFPLEYMEALDELFNS